MLFLLSPAKSLDYSTPVPVALAHSLPWFHEDAAQLMAVLRAQAPHDIAQLMALSDALAALNVARYAAWSPVSTLQNARQAVLAFNGDVYEGLQARSLTLEQLQWAQQHVVILSGLYGALRPLDLVQPHRLEMGTRLRTAAGANLYQFWGTRIAEYVNTLQQQEAHPVVVHLASQEYMKAVARPTLRARVVECVFEDAKAGVYKVVSFYAKRARGLMARWAIEQRVTEPAQLQAFHAEGYAYHAASSTPQRLVFRRALA